MEIYKQKDRTETPVKKNYDIIIVGAGYAGLACAREAASQGLRTVVIDKKKFAGQNPHTTGIIVKEAAERWHFPDHLTSPIENVKIHSPAMDHLDLSSPGYYFLAADTPGLLQWMAGEAEKAGAKILWKTPLRSIVFEKNGTLLPEYNLRCSLLIGADGPRSKTARLSGLGKNEKMIYGIEAELPYKNETRNGGAENSTNLIDKKTMYCFLDARLAPGYLAWVVPGVKEIQIGLASHKIDKVHLNHLFTKIGGRFGLKPEDVVVKKGGPIPAGGTLKKFWNKNVVLIGDAAGVVSPLTAGGIHTALESGKRTGQLTADYLQKRSPVHPGEALAKELPRFHFKKLLRLLMETVPRNFIYNLVLKNRIFRKFTGIIYFHNRGLFSREAWKEIFRGDRK